MPRGEEEFASWRGRRLVDAEGEKVGSIEEVYVDERTEQPEWMAVKTGRLGRRTSLVPLAEASASGEDVRVPYSRQQVEDAPPVEADGELSQDEEARLYAHYGLAYGERRSASGLPEGAEAGRAESGLPEVARAGSATTDDAMTRSEEELSVRKVRRVTERVRLRKRIVTEEVQVRVVLRREELEIEREPVAGPQAEAAPDGPERDEDEPTIILYAEEPVVEKRVVPKERVRLRKEAVTEERVISEQLRKERIDPEGDIR